MHMGFFLERIFVRPTAVSPGVESLHGSSSSPVSRLCPSGCASCSALNGCLSCKPRLFFHLELDGMRQWGTCLSSCPRGHYGVRSPHFNTCTRCNKDCAFCFNENFCTRCHKDLYSLHGQCHPVCPRGFEPDVQHMQCILQVHCKVGEWSEWGPCCQKRSMRACRKGEETRTRQVLQSPSVSGDPCPHVSEFRRCMIKKRQNRRMLENIKLYNGAVIYSETLSSL
uniref:R-spondin 3 n=1 Tax=Echeneis naucrates TaxID=173247 RepID=A0A665V8C3_ECHNA